MQTTTISMGRAGNAAFKQVQWLPTLCSKLQVNTGTKSEGNSCPTPKPSPAVKCDRAQAESASLRLPTTSVPVAERVVFSILAPECGGGNWPGFHDDDCARNRLAAAG